MMMKSNRYELKEFIAPHNHGRLFIGEDLSLKRNVFIYEVPILDETSVEEYIRKIGKSAHELTNLHFMHILDIEVVNDLIYVIINNKAGCILNQFILNDSISFQEALAMIIQFARSMLDAAEERSLNFSLAPNNIWITGDRTINVINTWDNPEPEQNLRMSKKLSLLFVQLVTRRIDVPIEAESFELRLRRSLGDIPFANQKEAAVTIITNAWNERLSLAAFVHSLDSLMDGLKAQNISVDSTKSDALDPELPAQDEYSFQPEHGDETESPRQRWRLIQLSKKLLLGLSLSLLGVAVFAGVFALLYGTIDLKGEPSSPTPAVSAKNEQQPSPSQTPKPDEKLKTPQPASSETVVVPALTGLTKEAAEQQALAAGLRYTYYLEVHQQAAGTVFKQEPIQGGTVARGSRVTFWISKGQ
jgi:serine/threonine-protein kinase